MEQKSEKANAIEYIGKEVYVKIDRPIGSCHPKYSDHIYLVNYVLYQTQLVEMVKN